jgi:hypothetical protein
MAPSSIPSRARSRSVFTSVRPSASFTIPSFRDVRDAVVPGYADVDVVSFTISSLRGMPPSYLAESPEASCHPRTAEIACNIGPRTQLPMVSVLTVINFPPSRMVGEYLMTGVHVECYASRGREAGQKCSMVKIRTVRRTRWITSNTIPIENRSTQSELRLLPHISALGSLAQAWSQCSNAWPSR